MAFNSGLWHRQLLFAMNMVIELALDWANGRCRESRQIFIMIASTNKQRTHVIIKLQDKLFS